MAEPSEPSRQKGRRDQCSDDVAEEFRQLGLLPPTDGGNAERWAAAAYGKFLYVQLLDQWLISLGTHWGPDVHGERNRLALEVLRSMKSEVPALSMKAAAELIRHALKSEQANRIAAMLSLAPSLGSLSVLPEQLDADPDLFNVTTGVLDTATGVQMPHSSGRLITKISPARFDENATAPTWHAFLRRILPDLELRKYLQRAVGYSLTGLTREHVLFFLHGLGANGKSVLLETLRELFGEGQYAKATSPELLLASQHGRHQEEIADLRGARFVTTVELGESRAWDESRVKWLTGGDTISARQLYKSRFSFQPTHKLWVAANHRPRVKGTDHGFWRRVHLIPFEVTIPEEERDPELRTKLQAELSGILSWALEGCLEWRKTGLKPPKAVLSATEEYRAGEDVVAAFLEDRCVLNPGAWASIAELYDDYQDWAEGSGERSMTKRGLGDALRARAGITEARGHGGQRRLNGIGLRAVRRAVG